MREANIRAVKQRPKETSQLLTDRAFVVQLTAQPPSHESPSPGALSM